MPIFCQKLTTALLESGRERMIIENISLLISTKESSGPSGDHSGQVNTVYKLPTFSLANNSHEMPIKCYFL